MQRFYRTFRANKDKTLQCLACNRFCLIENGKLGYCGVRTNEDGKIKLLTYEKPCAIALDPIEKKPLYHFYPGKKTLSFATYGCNFSCLHCQNYHISKEFLTKKIGKIPIVSAKEIIELAKEYKSNIISATYTEPTVFIEYALDVAKAAKKHKMKNVWVTNGYFSKFARKEIVKYIDAMNIDLKGDSKFYQKYCNNVDIENIKENIEFVYKKGIHVEITNLLIEDLNTSPKQIKEICKFIAKIDNEIPIHFSAFYPQYKLLNKPPTNKKVLEKAREIAKKEGLNNVYLGNV